MIYKMNLLKKELSYGYYQKQDGFKQLVALGVFFGMLAFSLYFVMQTLSQSVLSEDAAYFMRPSYFSTVFLYLVVSGVGFLIYFNSRFEQVSFAEVHDNSWYCMAHLGHPIWKMVLTKLFAQTAWIGVVHTTGFITTILLSSLLKFPLVADYLISQYVVGLVAAEAMLILAMLFSLMMRGRSNARSWLTFSSMALFAASFPTGFYALITDRERMRVIANLVTQSWYLPMLLGGMGAALIVCVQRGAHLARMFNPPAQTGAPRLTGRRGADIRVVVCMDTDSAFIRRQSRKLEAAYLPVRRINVLSIVGTFALGAVVVFMLSINLVLLALGYASPEKETSVMGYIPYIFQSTTMEPAVHFNDIAFFEKVDRYVQVVPGDIVLFKDEVNQVQVRKILDFYVDDQTGQQRINADITHYVEGAQQDALKTTLTKEQIYGRLVGVNRYMGVVVLFANTMVGRLLFLLAPTVLIFFSGPIFGFLRRAAGHAPESAR